MDIREEHAEDAPQIRRVHESAFGQQEEADIVERLRMSPGWIPQLSLVAVADEEVLAHVLLSKVSLDNGTEGLALAPMAVVPSRQRRGVGSALMREALSRASRTEFPFVVVVGHPDYYPRFGFERASRYSVTAPFDVPDEAWMLYRLPAYERVRPKGRVVYPPPFGIG